MQSRLSQYPHSSESQLDLLICHDPEGINMIEADANIVDNATVLSAIKLAKETGEAINSQITAFVKANGKQKADFENMSPPQTLISDIEKHLKDDLKKFLEDGADGAHMAAEDALKEKIKNIYQSAIDKEEIEEMKKEIKESVKERIKTELERNLNLRENNLEVEAPEIKIPDVENPVIEAPEIESEN